MAFHIPLDEVIEAAVERERDSWQSDGIPISKIAGECEREIWYVWRWALRVNFLPRMLMRFDSGDLAEDQIIRFLRLAQYEVRNENPNARGTTRDGKPKKKQYGAHWHGGLLRGYIDGLVRSEVSEDPEINDVIIERHGGAYLNDFHLLEGKLVASAKYVYDPDTQGDYDIPIGNKHPIRHPTKAGNESNIEGQFWKLKRVGVEKFKRTYYGQVQSYMGISHELESAKKDAKRVFEKWGLEKPLTRTLFIAKNGDTDQLHTEVIEYDPRWWLAARKRALRIANANEPPPRVSEYVQFPPCSLCDFQGICHLVDEMEVNCRTCAHATSATNKYSQRVMWKCAKHGAVGDNYTACAQYKPMVDPIDF
jgi:hypothetical protein